ncbi:MAG: hypothetical protein Q9M11_00005, partial [Mariprofundaceae bacterium]|nr:hypothetical protein [Mariprofundaceae bacterium]
EYLKIDNSQEGLFEKFNTLKEVGLAWFEKEALNTFTLKKCPSKSKDEMIQQVLGKSPNDVSRKLEGKEYYIANAMVYLSIFRELLTDDFIQRFSPSNQLDKLTIYNYHRLFQSALLDSLVLLNKFCIHIQKIEAPYGCGKNPNQHTLTLYQSLRQSIYGQSSYHSFIEVEPDLSISIIRQLLEIRVRRAFGVLAVYSSDKNSFEPLSMSKIFDVLKPFESNIDVSMPLSCLVRVYGWSNIFLHSGQKEYSWNHIFVTNYLKEFSLGKPSNEKGWSVHSGISMDKSTFEQIHVNLEKIIPENSQIVTCKPEAYISNA